jgi:hypothetical protein
VLLALPAALLVAVVPVATAAADAPYDVVTTGLRNPRGVALSADGKVYVAEAGDSGNVCFQGASTEQGGPLCAGPSSRISRSTRGRVPAATT